ncbi:hypothetical protein AB833_07225 [Chromatiales bacterium (ex Bugula neritina AB1)]|nr:hypothetical protein AB833_07225 [Chromatiales bacterium (ex Bugula neritina AB1)]
MFVLGASHADAPVQGKLEAFVVEFKDDKESLVAATDVEPNEVLEYRLTYVNKGESSISGMTVVGPVPEGTSYLGNSATADTAASLMVSIDGGRTFELEPVKRNIVKNNGEMIEQIVPPEEYTHLQWTAEDSIKASGGKQFYSYRVRVK